MLSENESIITYPLLRNFYNSLSYKGGYNNTIKQGVTQAQFDAFAIPYSDSISTHELNPYQVAALRNILTMAKEKNMDIKFVEFPAPLKVVESKLYNQAHNSLKKMIINDFRVPFISNVNYGFNVTRPELFCDAFHLSTQGRDLYTKRIIRNIK